MFRLIATVFIGLLITSMATAQEAGPAPTFSIVRKADPAKGHVIITRPMQVFENIVVVEKVMVNGQVVDVSKTVRVPVYRHAEIVYDISTSRVITPDGKQLAIDAVFQRLKADSVIAISGNFTAPSAAYLRALNPDVLVIIPGEPKKEPTPK